jgi:hypothetical protein
MSAPSPAITVAAVARSRRPPELCPDAPQPQEVVEDPRPRYWVYVGCWLKGTQRDSGQHAEARYENDRAAILDLRDKCRDLLSNYDTVYLDIYCADGPDGGRFVTSAELNR